MDQLIAEKRLTFSYLLCVLVGAIGSITSGIAWSHWYRTLDQCIGRNCSCILYGEHTPSQFLGGGQAPCIWVTYGPLIYVFFGIGFVCFHGYRVAFTLNSPGTRSVRQVVAKMEGGDDVQLHAISQEVTSPLPKAYWVTASIFTIFFAIYSLVHFAVFLDGYYATCNQFRKTLEQLLNLHGSVLPVIHNRLSCQSIFDFMDYMQPDSVNSYRNGFINTGLDLVIGTVAAGFSWISFLYASVINIRLARRKIS